MPPALRTASTVAAPRPETPPVIRMLPRGRIALLREFGVVRHRPPRRPAGTSNSPARSGRTRPRRRAAPTTSRSGRSASRVVAALDPDVRAQPIEHRGRRRFVEHRDRVHKGQCGEQPGPVAVTHQRTAWPLERPDRFVGVQADDESVAQRPGLAQQADVAGVQQVEAAAGGDQPAAFRVDPVGEAEGVGRGVRIRRRTVLGGQRGGAPVGHEPGGRLDGRRDGFGGVRAAEQGDGGGRGEPVTRTAGVDHSARPCRGWDRNGRFAETVGEDGATGTDGHRDSVGTPPAAQQLGELGRFFVSGQDVAGFGQVRGHQTGSGHRRGTAGMGVPDHRHPQLPENPPDVRIARQAATVVGDEDRAGVGQDVAGTLGERVRGGRSVSGIQAQQGLPTCPNPGLAHRRSPKRQGQHGDVRLQ